MMLSLGLSVGLTFCDVSECTLLQKSSLSFLAVERSLQGRMLMFDVV